MNIRRSFAMGCVALGMLGAGCGASAPSVPPSPSLAPAVVPAPTAPAAAVARVPDACVIVTKELIKAKLGGDVDAGVSKASNMEGSTCSFKVSNAFTSIIVQLSPKPDTYYMPESWVKGAKPLGIGSKGVYTGPDSGNGFAQFVKDGKLAVITGGVKDMTEAQWKAFLQAIGDAL